MRGAFGLIGLLLALAIVAVVAKRQLAAVRGPVVTTGTPAASAATAAGERPLPALPAMPTPSAAERFQADAKAALQSTVDERARASDEGGR